MARRYRRLAWPPVEDAADTEVVCQAFACEWRPHQGAARSKALLEEGEGAHRLPDWLMWAVTLTTAVGMAILNLLTIYSMRTLVKWKFSMMQSRTDQDGVPGGAMALIGTAAFLASCCMAVIFWFDEGAGSSGAPENRGWLNGNDPGNIFTGRRLLVRGVATILGNAAGFPVGREGPTVSMGSNLAFLITTWAAQPYAEKWVDIDQSETTRMQAKVVDEERIDAAKRVACAVGGACGMAMIFDSPIGGILYMFEEMTASCWPLDLTFRAFTGTITCALLSRAMLNFLCSADTKDFVVYEWSPQRHPWDWWDLPLILVIGGVLGPFSALHTAVCLRVGTARQTLMKRLQPFQPYAKVLDAILYAAFCASMCSLVALIASCEPLRPGDARELVRYNCPHGYYNPVASLLLTTSEGAVNLLFSRRNDGEIEPGNALLALCAYTVLNVGLTGVPAPSGNFTGTMLIGGLVGRMIGAAAQKYKPTWAVASSGVYAMVGSASMLCGFKRMSLAVVWFVCVASNDFNLVPPLMLAVMVSLVLAHYCKEQGFDEEQVLRRNVLFLEPEPPRLIDKRIATDLLDELPPEAQLSPEATAGEVRAALAHPVKVQEFPVLRGDGICIGFTTRDRLGAALEAFEAAASEHLATHGPGNGAASLGRLDEPAPCEAGEFEHLLSDESPRLGRLPPGTGGGKLPVATLVDPAPYTILEDMPGPRAYALFARGGVCTACVVSDGGLFKGMISRAGLIKITRAAEQ